MHSLLRPLRHLHADQHGLTTVEYAIVLCLIAAASVGLWNELGASLHEKLGAANDEIDTNVAIEFE